MSGKHETAIGYQIKASEQSLPTLQHENIFSLKLLTQRKRVMKSFPYSRWDRNGEPIHLNKRWKKGASKTIDCLIKDAEACQPPEWWTQKCDLQRSFEALCFNEALCNCICILTDSAWHVEVKYVTDFGLTFHTFNALCRENKSIVHQQKKFCQSWKQHID